MSRERHEAWSPEGLNVTVQFNNVIELTVRGKEAARTAVEKMAGVLGTAGMSDRLDQHGLADFWTSERVYFIRRSSAGGGEDYRIRVDDERFGRKMSLRDQIENETGIIPLMPSIYIDLEGDPEDILQFWQQQPAEAHERLSRVTGNAVFGNNILPVYGQLLYDAARSGNEDDFRKAWQGAQRLLVETAMLSEEERQELFGGQNQLPSWWTNGLVADMDINPHTHRISSKVFDGKRDPGALGRLNFQWAQELGTDEEIVEPARQLSVPLEMIHNVRPTIIFEGSGRFNLRTGTFEVAKTGRTCRVVVDARVQVSDDQTRVHMHETLRDLTLGHSQVQGKIDMLYAA